MKRTSRRCAYCRHLLQAWETSWCGRCREDITGHYNSALLRIGDRMAEGVPAEQAVDELLDVFRLPERV